jgi:hypothetical protein
MPPLDVWNDLTSLTFFIACIGAIWLAVLFPRLRLHDSGRRSGDRCAKNDGGTAVRTTPACRTSASAA